MNVPAIMSDSIWTQANFIVDKKLILAHDCHFSDILSTPTSIYNRKLSVTQSVSLSFSPKISTLRSQMYRFNSVIWRQNWYILRSASHRFHYYLWDRICALNWSIDESRSIFHLIDFKLWIHSPESNSIFFQTLFVGAYECVQMSLQKPFFSNKKLAIVDCCRTQSE